MLSAELADPGLDLGVGLVGAVRGAVGVVRQRTQAVNALRGLLGEFGIAEPQGIRHVGRLRAHLDGDIVPDP